MTTMMLDLTCPETLDPLMKVAGPLAKRLSARIVGAHVSPAFEGVAPIEPFALSDAYYDEIRARYEADVKKRTKQVDEKLSKVLAADGSLTGNITHATAGPNGIGAKLARLARNYDLVVALQKGKINRAVAPEVLALDAGRPVLVVPEHTSSTDIGSHVMIAWNGTREAARAAFDVLPLVKPEGRITVVAIDTGQEDAGKGFVPGDTLARTLARDGLKVEAMSRKLSSKTIGNELLNAASDIGADMIAMGAYGHTRWRELVFGGATRSIVDQITVPVLMAH
ncbi:universal stress protein [Notoacmeibacter ruber]|nr:universal stress protein [Notoacmeibacter ruber]